MSLACTRIERKMFVSLYSRREIIATKIIVKDFHSQQIPLQYITDNNLACVLGHPKICSGSDSEPTIFSDSSDTKIIVY